MSDSFPYLPLPVFRFLCGAVIPAAPLAGALMRGWQGTVIGGGFSVAAWLVLYVTSPQRRHRIVRSLRPLSRFGGFVRDLLGTENGRLAVLCAIMTFVFVGVGMMTVGLSLGPLSLPLGKMLPGATLVSVFWLCFFAFATKKFYGWHVND